MKELLAAYPWLSEDDLADEPWLVLYLREGDAALDEARVRFLEDQEALQVRMERAGVEYRKRLEKGGMLTTAYESHPEGRADG